MNLPRNKTRRLLQALMLALLLNLSGHVFVHLGDAVFEGEDAHITSQHESRTTSAPQHQCSICQDHQHLSLEAPPVAAVMLAANTTYPTRQNDVTPSFLPAHFKPTRAPPRG